MTVTTEDEYFPPPPELRELLRSVSATLGFLSGQVGPGSAGSPVGRTDPVIEDRGVSAADVLDMLAW